MLSNFISWSAGSSVGSTTIFNSIAAGVFDHKRHLSPLLDMSDRSMQLQRTLDEKERSRTHRTMSEYSSSKSSPSELASSAHSSKLQITPRDLHSQISSTTEYDALPHRKDSAQSSGTATHLMLSPDLAQRVSNILNQSTSLSLPKLSFDDTSPTYRQQSSTHPSPREGGGRTSRSTTSASSILSHDELDQHVSDVLRRSSHVLETTNQPSPEITPHQADDLSYLDKYMSPLHTSPGADTSYGGYSTCTSMQDRSHRLSTGRYEERRPSLEQKTDSSVSSASEER